MSAISKSSPPCTTSAPARSAGWPQSPCRGRASQALRAAKGFRMRTLPWILLGLTAAYAGQASEPYPVVLGAEKAELVRSMEQLKKQEVAPYFLSYEIVETHAATGIGACGGV